MIIELITCWTVVASDAFWHTGVVVEVVRVDIVIGDIGLGGVTRASRTAAV